MCALPPCPCVVAYFTFIFLSSQSCLDPPDLLHDSAGMAGRSANQVGTVVLFIQELGVLDYDTVGHLCLAVPGLKVLLEKTGQAFRVSLDASYYELSASATGSGGTAAAEAKIATHLKVVAVGINLAMVVWDAKKLWETAKQVCCCVLTEKETTT